MINLKKHDPVADVVRNILQQEALKGNQDKIDANHNNKIDAQDFKILRAKKKKVEEETDVNDRSQDTLAGPKKTERSDDVGPGSNGKSTKVRFHAGPKNEPKAKNEEVEQIDELSKSTLSSYLDKKKAEYMKGKTVSGSKENAKDIQNMGKAHDKLNKEEVEQIDELSINTLSRVKHAAISAASDASREGDEEKATKRYNLAGNASNKIEKKNRAAGLAPSGQHTFEEVESLEEKNWIAGAIKKPGAETAAAKKAGMSVQAYAEKHKHDSGKAGKRARLAITLKHMKEKFEEPILDELINEVMSKDATAGDWIHDFVHSDNPKFAGKSKAKRKEMALATYYSKKNEEVELDEMDKSQKGAPGWNISDDDGGKEHYGKSVTKKSFLKTAGKALHKALTGGSDKDHLDRLRKDMYKKEEVEQFEIYEEDLIETELMLEKNKPTQPDKWASAKAAAKSKFAVYPSAYANAWASKKYKAMGGGWRSTNEEVVEEGWDDMVKDAQEKVKSGPKPSGGSGKKEGSRYGGSKQKDKPEQEDMKEAKNPSMDAGVGSPPSFVTDNAKPMQVAQSMAKKSLARMRSEMLGKTGTSE